VTAVGATAPATTLRRPAVDPGLPFVGFTFDYLVIGGGFSLLVLALLQSGTMPSVSVFLREHLWTFVLLSNSAHFAASTVRLYTRPGSFRELPFLTMGLPLASLLVLALGFVFPGALGQNLLSLYLTWSPYHYSAQAYGIAVLYCYRSGAPWDEGEKRWLRLACFAPFIFTFLTIQGAGLSWLMPEAVLAYPAAAAVRGFAASLAQVATFAGPIVLFARHQMAGRARLPLISLLAVLANAVWLVMLNYEVAMVLAVIAIFHGLQYLALVTIVHVKERVKRPDNRAPAWRHAAGFYACCLGLGYLLFQVWPHAFVLAGFSYAESLLLVVAVINIHHFIVDAFIWRLRRDPSYAAAAAAGATDPPAQRASADSFRASE
jgi:hypothetical protein